MIHQILEAQIVVTVAGQAEITGTDNGPAFEATFNNPHGIAVDSDGNVYTADRWSHLIRKITPDGMVSTFAGQANISGDMDGDISVATFYEPWGISIDHEGNLLVADTRNNKIRKVTQAGMVTTIAGSGNFGSSNGVGTASTFGNPTGIDSDADGNIYVADHLTHVIRKIDVNGVVTTIAGTPYATGNADGPGGIASFNRPYGLTLDHDGNLLVADEWNHKIRKIDTDGIVTTFAGNGLLGHADGEVENASFNYPWDIAVDSLGNVFVADGYNYLIRKITTDGLVGAFAGTLETSGANDGMGSLATFSGATSVAISPLTKEIFIGDAYNNLVRKIIDLNQGVSVLISNNGLPAVCAGETLDVYASPDVYSNYFFYIDGDIVQSGSNPNLSISNLEVGTHQIQVVVQDNGNTFQSPPRTITIYPLPEPTVSIVGELTFYEGDSVILISSDASSYFWLNGETTQTITVTESGSYQVEVTDENGCYGLSESIEVVVLSNPEAPQVSIDGSTTICPGESRELTSNYDTGNQWLKDGWPIEGATNSMLQVNSTGIYQVQVILPSGTAVLSETIEVELLPDFEVDFTANLTNLISGSTVQFEITDNTLVNLQWNFGDTNSTDNTASVSNPQHTYQASGSYTVTLTAVNEAGCSGEMVKENFIQVSESGNGSGPINPTGEDDLFVPTAFTPNGDGENDFLYVRGSNIVGLSFNVFNEWGAMIFETDDPSQGWDGKHNGQLVQNGNYTYCLRVTLLDGKTTQLAGHVSVIR